MTRDFAPTGKRWPSSLPVEWSLVPAKGAFGERRERSGPEDIHLTPSQSHGVLPQSDYMRVTGNRVVLNLEGQDSMKRVEPDDFVIHLRSFQGGIEWSGLGGKVSMAYTVLVPRARVVPAYYRWVLKSEGYVQELRSTTDQLRDGQSIKYSTFAKIPLPMPPLEEQRRIADFLDAETAQIDALIAEQEHFIALLRERRQVGVSVLLSRGVDAGVETMPTGNPLIGSIPSHWKLVPARFLTTIMTGAEDSGNATDDGEYPFFVRGNQVLRIGHFSFDGEAVMTPGDGQGGTGKVFHYFNGKFEAHQRVYVFKDFRCILGRYFYFYLSSFLGPVALAGSNTVTMESLRRPLLASFPVAVPPLAEQERILGRIEDRVGRIETLIAEAEHNIVLSKERRAALITAAVTGQIEVTTGRAA